MERGAAPVDPRLLLPRAAAGADADRPRSGASVSARVQQEPELRGRARRAGRVRPQLRRGDRAGAARAAARDPAAAGARRRSRVRVRVPVLDPARAHGRAVLRHEGRGLLPVPRHAQLRPVRRRGRDQEPAHRAAGRALPPALRRRGAPRGRRQLLAAHGGIPAAAVQPARRRPLSGRRPGQPLPPARGARPGGAPGPQVPAVPARAAAGARRRRTCSRC